MGRSLFYGEFTLDSDLVKIILMADELDVSVKTIYNWISSKKLTMVRPGYVNRMDAYEVWLEQKSIRKTLSQFMSAQGTKRDANGRFKSRSEERDQTDD
jgi:hypothetical protein